MFDVECQRREWLKMPLFELSVEHCLPAVGLTPTDEARCFARTWRSSVWACPIASQGQIGDVAGYIENCLISSLLKEPVAGGALSGSANDAASDDDPQDDGDVDADQVVFICEGQQLGYGTKRAWEVAY